MRPYFTLPLLLCLAACSPERPTAITESDAVTLITGDDYRIAADVYNPDAASAPGLLLVHDSGGSRRDWQRFAKRAQQRGFYVVALDLRGHGESARQAGEFIDHTTFRREEWLAAIADLRAGWQELKDRGADPDDLAVVGAGLGATLALSFAAEQPDVQAAVLVSPGMDLGDIDTAEALEAYGNRPVMFVYAMGDTYSATSAQGLHRQAPGYKELREYQGAARGVNLFETSNHAVEQIFVWLKPIVGPGRADPA